jgi:hypothetical protein
MKPKTKTKPALFLTRLLPDEVMKKLVEKFRLRYNRLDRPLSKRELLRGVRTAEGLISMLSDPIDREIIGAAPNLRIISNYAVGVNNIDLAAAAERKIIVTNTPRRREDFPKRKRPPDRGIGPAGRRPNFWAAMSMEKPWASSAWDGSVRRSPAGLPASR